MAENWGQIQIFLWIASCLASAAGGGRIDLFIAMTAEGMDRFVHRDDVELEIRQLF